MACPVLTLFSQREDRINQHTCIRRGKNLVRAAFEGEGCVFLRRSLEGLSTAGVNANWRAGKEREGIAVRIFQFSTAWIPSISNNGRIDFRYEGGSGRRIKSCSFDEISDCLDIK